MKRIALFFLLFNALFYLYAQEKAYVFKKGQLLDYTLELQTKIHFDLEHSEKFIPVQSQYRFRFFVLDKGTEGEAVIAATSHLENATVLESEQKGGPQENGIREWVKSLKKDDSAAFILDSYGNILKGRMLWPDATCYHLPRILEGLAIRKRDSNLNLGGRYQIVNQFVGFGKIGEKEYSVYKTKNTFLDLKLFVDDQNSLPFQLEARYFYYTFRSQFEEKLTLTLQKVTQGLQVESLLDDEAILAAIIQASVLSKRFGLGGKVIQKALASENSDLRILGSSYLAQAGIPQGLDLSQAGREKNESIQFNLAKAEYRSGRDRSGLEKSLKKGSEELKERAERILSKGTMVQENETELFPILDNAENIPTQYKGKNIYDLARSALLKNKETLHFGPRPFALESGSRSKRIFHYNVYTPLDYDPEERYPIIIYLTGGNGFADSFMGVLRDLVPSHYILVCPDSDYRMWWEPDQFLMFDDLLKRVIQDYSVDQDRVYLQGFSNGGIATYLFGYSHPDRFAAVASLMGYSMFPREEKEVETEMSLNMLNTPLLIIHGDRDRVISIEPDRMLVGFLRANDIPHRFIEVSGGVHNISFENFHKDIMNFFRKNKRNPAPSKINLIVDNPKYNRNFWISVDAKLDPQKRARLKAQRKGNILVLETKNVKTLSLLLNDWLYKEGNEYEVIVNDKSVFRGKLQADVHALKESLENELDPARLYGIKLTFDVAEKE